MYVQYKKPDQEAMAELISNLRGERTLATYADDIKRSTPGIKVSASTLSRACNCGDNPVNYDLLEAIAKISENPEVTFAQLLEANGTRSQEDDKQLTKKTEAERRREVFLKYDRQATMTIQNEIVGRGYPVRQLSYMFNGATLNGYLAQQDRVFPRNYTFGYSVSGMSPCSTWKFMLNTVRVPAGSSAQSVEAHVGHFINKVASVFAGDSFEAELYENEKYSFVFIDKTMYELFLNRLSDHDIMVNGLMTAILLDIDAEKVVEETQLKRYDGEMAHSLFNTPMTVNEDIDEIGDPFEIIDDEE